MTLRHLAVCCSGIAMLGIGATLLRAQAPPTPLEDPIRVERNKLRAEVIKLRTEVEMLDFDYQIARELLRAQVGMSIAPKFLEEAFGRFGGKPVGDSPKRSDEEQKKVAEEAKAEELENRKESEAIAAIKKELARQFANLAEKRLDLEYAERKYREISP